MPALTDFPEPPDGEDFISKEEAAALAAEVSNVLPTPSFAQIGWMKRNVQAIGGIVLGGVCRPRGIAYPANDGVRTVMVNTQGCGNETLALIPRPGGEAVKVCLVCDGCIEWPRLYGEEATGSPPDPPPFAGEGQAHWA